MQPDSSVHGIDIVLSMNRDIAAGRNDVFTIIPEKIVAARCSLDENAPAVLLVGPYGEPVRVHSADRVPG